MARKISEHPEVAPGTVFDGTEIALFNKAGVTYKGTTSQILAYKADLDSPHFTGPVDFAGPVVFNDEVSLLGPVSGLDKADVGLNLVDNTPDLSKPVSTPVQTALDLKVPTSALAQPSGVATLGVDGKLTPAQMPASVDAVQEYANVAAFPATGASNIIYLAADTNKSYRWGTTVYVEIVASPGSTDAVPEGTTNLYHTAARVRAVVLSGLSTAVNAVVSATDTVLGAIGKLQAQNSAHFGSGGAAHAVATTSVAGFLSAADKTKLDALSPGGGTAGDLAGGAAGQIPYQSAPDSTTFSSGLVFDGTSALTLGPTGGNAIFRAAGPASATANGGQVSIVGGTGGATSGSGGAITLTSGTTSGSGSAGTITVKPGNGVAANSGAGVLVLSGGDSSGNLGGAVTLKGGNSLSGAFAGGAVNIEGGTSSAGTAGAVTVSTANVERFRVLANGAWSIGSDGTSYGTAGQVLTSNGNAAPTWQTPAGGGVGGTDTQLQYNNGGVMAGASGLNWINGSRILTIGTTSAGFIQNPAAVTGGTVALNIRTVAPSTSGNTGALNLTAGNAVTGGSAGSINLTAGNGIGTVVAGSINLLAGGTAGTATCGPVTVEAGTSTNASTAGGAITITGGRNSTAAGTGGSVAIAGGPVNTTGTAGNTTVRGGNAGTGGTGGNALIWGGSGGTSGGKIVLRTFPTTSGVDRLQILANGAWSVGDGATFTGTSGQALLSAGDSAAPAWGDVVTPSGAQTLTGKVIQGLTEKYSAMGASAIDLNLGNVFSKTITTTTTFTVTSVAAAGNVSSFLLEITNGGAFAVNWFAGVTWDSGAPPALTASGLDILAFYTRDGGTTWRGFVLAKAVA